MYSIHGLLHRHEVLNQYLERLVQLHNLALKILDTMVEVSLEGSCLHQFVYVINLTIFAKLYYFAVQLFETFLKLRMYGCCFFMDQLVNISHDCALYLIF